MTYAYPIVTTTLTAGALAVLAWSRTLGMYSHQLFAVVLFLGLLWGLAGRAWWWWSGRLHGALQKTDTPQLFQACGRGFFWLMLGTAMLLIFPHTADMTFLLVVLAGMALGRVALEVSQPAVTNPGPTVVMILAGLGLGAELAYAFLPTVAPVVRLTPPFSGEWVVLQGGHSPMQSHHLSAYNQAFALDLVRLVEGRIMDESAPDPNAMLYCWDQPLTSPVAGTVVALRDDMEDSEGPNLVGDVADAAGNHVVIRTDEGQFVVLAHLKRGTVAVEVGQEVAPGDLLGHVGNSGNTTLSHLHMQVQTHADIWHPDNRSLPFAFGDGRVLRRNDRVSAGSAGE